MWIVGVWEGYDGSSNNYETFVLQCAHGRPTTAPLVNLEALHKHIAKMASLSDGEDQLWHGLRRHELSLERAEKRLSLSKS